MGLTGYKSLLKLLKLLPFHLPLFLGDSHLSIRQLRWLQHFSPFHPLLWHSIFFYHMSRKEFVALTLKQRPIYMCWRCRCYVFLLYMPCVVIPDPVMAFVVPCVTIQHPDCPLLRTAQHFLIFLWYWTH